MISGSNRQPALPRLQTSRDLLGGFLAAEVAEHLCVKRRVCCGSDGRRAGTGWGQVGGELANGLQVGPRVRACVSSSDLAPLVVMNIGSSVPAELKAWGDNPAAWTG